MTIPRFTTAVGKPASATPTPRQQRSQLFHMPAPIGMDSRSPVAALGADKCIYTYNLLPYELGLRTREGYFEWANGFAPDEVRTILPFVGNREDRTNDRLFAANRIGIYDITSRGTDGVTPPIAYTWPSQGVNAGYCIYTHFTNDAGAHFMLLADETNGLHEYSEGTGTWDAISGITGVDPTQVFFVAAHKARIWLIPRDSSTAYYLPVNAKAGEAKPFNFGTQFREGGTLVGIYSWTIDGGAGVDDYFVALTREGGVAVYRGGDPANASTWSLVGVWYIGRIPAGHRSAMQYGGQFFILSEHGVISLNELLRGASVDDAAEVVTGEITRLVREELLPSIDKRGWEMRVYPRENFFVIGTPLEADERTQILFVRNLTTNGWGMVRGMPLQTGDVFQGEFYFADDQGSVWRWDGVLDNVRLDETVSARRVPFSMLTSFQGPGPFMRGQFVRPYFLSEGVPAFAVKARYDYDLAEVRAGQLGGSVSTAAVWDESLWDQSVWGGALKPSASIRGVSGYGHKMAVALRGETDIRLTLVNFEVQYETGGLL